jgi:hypothetical protein
LGEALVVEGACPHECAQSTRNSTDTLQVGSSPVTAADPAIDIHSARGRPQLPPRPFGNASTERRLAPWIPVMSCEPFVALGG